MYAVGRLGSYITRGVYTVSGPFHPFGGAVDIIVVEQQDGSFKSSPWYVKFGKFQGVLKAKEKIVSINVNGDQADFHMYLDHKGEAFFLREEDAEEGDSAVIYPSSSGEDTDGQSSSERRTIKSKSHNFDAGQSDTVTQIDVGNGKILTRTNSRRSRIMGLVFGRKSMKENGIREGEGSSDVVRADSLESAEIAADLLEMRWSTNLASRRHRKDNSSQFAPDSSGGEANKDFPIDDAQGKMESTLHNNNTVNSLNHPVLHNLHEEIDNHDNGMGTSPRFGFQKPGSFDKDVGVEMSCLNTKHIIGTSNLGEIGFQETDGLNSETLREIEELAVAHAGHNENAIVFFSEFITPDPVSDEMDLCQSKMLKEEEQEFKEDILLADNCGSKEESGADEVKEFVVSETLDSSRVGLDDSGGQTDEALYNSCGGGVEDPVHSLSEVISEQETSLLVVKEPLDAQIHGNGGTSADSCVNSIVTETYTQMVSADPENGSVKEVESCNVCTISGFSNSLHEIQDGENTRNENNMSKIPCSSKPVGDYQGFRGDSVSTGAITVSPSESSEEQAMFGDFDDFNHGEANCIESISSNQGEKENLSSVTSKGSEAVIESLNSSDESHSSSNDFVKENTPDDVEDFRQKSRIVSRLIDIPRSNKVVPEDVGRLSESLPNMWSPLNEMVVDDPHSLGRSLDSNCKSSNWDPLKEDVSSGIKSDEDKEVKVFNAQPTVENAQISEEFRNGPAKLAVGDSSKVIGASNEGWGGWPSLFKRSRSMKTTHPAPNSTRSSDAEKVLDSSTCVDGEKDLLTPEVKKKKKVRAITPTPEQLASLNLKAGKNTVTFTFSTAMLGTQQVDARIYLWKWDSRVVISDVDGTITKSDVLGQFMPLVGRDWSQTGVAHLFSAIKENGYQLLFLSARAISQAYHTRQFLFNLKQDGKALPEGPVVISPDGLFPSLFREVIRRAPHEFKIACLEDIRALFPSDRKPFYAGFGNRDTDEYSYLQVGIPKGKIFIINPKGEVAVNRRVDTKSYTSLHTLVHDMFPPMSSSEQEDFNSWNFWKLPHPSFDN